MARPPFQPTENERAQVEAMAAYGIPQELIVRFVVRPSGSAGAVKPISLKTLRKHFREELDTAGVKIESKVAESLYKRAIDLKHPQGAISAMFLLKARFGWTDKQVVEHTGKDGGPIGFELDLSDATPDELAVLERFLAKKVAQPRAANDAAAA